MAEFRIVSSAEIKQDQRALLVEQGGVFYRTPLLKLGLYESETQVIVDQDDQLIGAFNVCRMRLKGIKALSHPMLHPHCALFAPARSTQQVSITSWNKRVLDAVAGWLLNETSSIVSVAFPVDWPDMQPMIWNGLRCGVKYTYRIGLSDNLSHEEKYSGSLRSDLRKARDLGVEVNDSASAAELHECLVETSASKGFEVGGDVLKTLLDEVTTGRAKLRVARKDGAVIGFALTVHDARSAYYLLGGLSRKDKVRGALGLLLSELIAEYAHSGIKVFDFEGSMLPGVERFFRSFGGDLVPYYVVSRAKWPFNWLLRWRGRREF